MSPKSKPDADASTDTVSTDTASPAAVSIESADEWGNWRYIGEHPNTYAAIPVTVAPGDVITHPGPPAGDGRWELTDAEVTRHRDNDPKEG